MRGNCAAFLSALVTLGALSCVHGAQGQSVDFSVSAFVAPAARSSQVLALEALIGNANATADKVQAAILAVASSADVDAMSVRNSVCQLIMQLFQSWITQIDNARNQGNLNFLGTITTQIQPRVDSFMAALNRNAGFKRYKDLTDYLSRCDALFDAAAAMYEIFMRDARVKELSNKNAQLEDVLDASVNAHLQELGTMLTTLNISSSIQEQKASRLTTDLSSVLNQRNAANSIISQSNLGQA